MSGAAPEADAASGAERVALYRRLPLVESDRWWADLARRSPDGRVLELGAGAGRLTTAFLDAGAEVTAVERDPGMLSALRDRVGGRARLLGCDAAELPPLEPFGLVALPTSLLNELPDAAARHAVLAGAAAACRPDGRIALHLLGPWWLADLPAHVTGRLQPGDGTAPIEVTVTAGPFDAWSGRRRAELTYRFPDGRRLRDHLDAAAVTGTELELTLAAVGCEIEDRFGPAPPDTGPRQDDAAWHVVCRPRAG
ncbi:MAG: methyltransferase domain-containing protein [Nitriliruptor sp.]